MADEAGETPAKSGMMGKMSTGELLMGIGAAWIFIVVYLLGNRIANDYGNTTHSLMAGMLSLVVLASAYHTKSGKGSRWAEFYPWVAISAAWGAVIVAGADLLDGIINDFSSSGEFYEITFYVAAAVLAVGAWQVGQEDN